jgi:hypothetical protein
MILRIAYDFDSAAVFGDGIALGNGIRRVVGALGLHIWTNLR